MINLIGSQFAHENKVNKKIQDRMLITLLKNSLFQSPNNYLFESRTEYDFIKNYEICKKDASQKILGVGSFLKIVIVIKINEIYDLILFNAPTSPRDLFDFWNKVVAANLSGFFVIDEASPRMQIGNKISRFGRLEGNILFAHRKIWTEYVNDMALKNSFSGSDNWLRAENAVYIYVPCILGYDKAGTINLSGLKVQVKFINATEIIDEFVIQ